MNQVKLKDIQDNPASFIPQSFSRILRGIDRVSNGAKLEKEMEEESRQEGSRLKSIQVSDKGYIQEARVEKLRTTDTHNTPHYRSSIAFSRRDTEIPGVASRHKLFPILLKYHSVIRNSIHLEIKSEGTKFENPSIFLTIEIEFVFTKTIFLNSKSFLLEKQKE